MFKRIAGLIFVLAFSWPLALARAQEPLPAGVHQQIIWAPDYYGQKIYRYVINQTTNPATFSSTTIKLSKKAATENCYPNSVAVKSGDLYIVCNSDYGGLDQILVLNASTYAYVKTITGTGPSGTGGTYNYFSGASLIGIAFDSHKNLWATGYYTNSLYRIPAASLTSASPQIDLQVVDSPDSPAGITFDSSGNMWVVGQYSGGILLEFSAATINVGSNAYLQNNPYNPNPAYCLSNVLTGCNPNSGLFNNPEGVAAFDGAIWVSNNGGNAPASTLVRAVPKSGGVMKASTYGSVTNKPFACPGGLFAPILSGSTPQLWVNDEGYGFVNGDCGASSSSQGSGVGLVHAFTAADLMNHQTKPTPEVFPGSTQLKTGSPGFGGVFVQLE